MSSAPTSTALPATQPVWRQFYALTKPRVIQLIVFCALIGMVLAVPGLPSWSQVQLAAIASFGIWLVSGVVMQAVLSLKKWKGGVEPVSGHAPRAMHR